MQLGLEAVAAAGGALGFSPNTAAFFSCLPGYCAGLGSVDAGTPHTHHTGDRPCGRSDSGPGPTHTRDRDEQSEWAPDRD